MVHLTLSQLRRYYENAYGAVFPRPDPDEVNTFEEYYALVRIGQPAVGPMAAAAGSKRPDFVAAATDVKASPLQASNATRESFGAATDFRKRSTFDLTEVPNDVRFLLLDRIVTISGWPRVQKWPTIQRVDCVLSGTGTADNISEPKPLERLIVKSCSAELLKTLIAVFRAASVRVEHVAETTLSLATVVRDNQRVRDLMVAAPRVTDVRALANRPLERLWLENLDLNAHLASALRTMRSLKELTLLSEKPFGPSLVEDVQPLQRLRVPAFAEHRAEWIDFAVQRPRVACEFLPVRESAFRIKVETHEVHRGVTILRVAVKKKPTYEISDNVAGDVLRRNDIDNHVLRDFLQRECRSSGRPIDVSSESDMLIVQTRTLEDARWAIDLLIDKFK